MPWEISSNAIVILPLFLQLLGLTLAVIIDPYIRKAHRRIMLIVAALVLSLIFQSVLEFHAQIPLERTILSVYGYSVRPLIIILFFYIVDNTKNYSAAWVMFAANLLIYLTAFFSKISFYITDDNLFRRGPLGYTCHIVSFILLAYLVYLTANEYRRVRRHDIIIPILNAVIIITAAILDTGIIFSRYPVSLLIIAIVSSSVFYYIWLHLQFVREHERSLLAEQRIQIMMSQIQPHFLYNTLATIQALCMIDPQKAFDTTEKFGVYLRQNIDSLSQSNLISVKKELEHTRIYAEIEMTRFPNIKTEYDIKDDDFLLPALSIQPIVENAIRHGVRNVENALVTVSTYRTDKNHTIVIEDNGRGFLYSGMENKNDENQNLHIGIKNVRERLEKMCGGSLNIKSLMDTGTTVTIEIPIRGGEAEGAANGRANGRA